MMEKLPSASTLALASILFSASGYAVTVTYTDQAAFLAALPGPASTLDFDSVAAGTLIPSGGAVEGITFTYDFGGVSMAVTDGDQFGGGGPFNTTSGSNFLGTDDADIFLDDDDFSMTFAPVSAIGMFFITAEEPGFTIFDEDIQLTVDSTTASKSILQDPIGC